LQVEFAGLDTFPDGMVLYIDMLCPCMILGSRGGLQARWTLVVAIEDVGIGDMNVEFLEEALDQDGFLGGCDLDELESPEIGQFSLAPMGHVLHLKPCSQLFLEQINRNCIRTKDENSVPNSTSAPPFGRSGHGRGILIIGLDGQSLDLKPSGLTDLPN